MFEHLIVFSKDRIILLHFSHFNCGDVGDSSLLAVLDFIIISGMLLLILYDDDACDEWFTGTVFAY